MKGLKLLCGGKAIPVMACASIPLDVFFATNQMPQLSTGMVRRSRIYFLRLIV
jgi:hypothetical protein